MRNTLPESGSSPIPRAVEVAISPRHSNVIARFFLPILCLLGSVVCGRSQIPANADAEMLVKKIQGELGGPAPEKSTPDPGVPHGEYLRGEVTNPTVYPGTENYFQVYVPSQYNPAKPACLLIKLDGFGPAEGNVLDNLIAKKEIPVMIGLGITSGTVFKGPRDTPRHTPLRNNRTYEFDSVNARFADFVLQDVLPAVQKLKTNDGRAINLSPDGNDHAACGGSTGGIGSFTLAWQRPDQFTRIFDFIGTFVSMRGGNDYPALIRKTDPKSFRIFLEDGSWDAWNPLFGSWFENNQQMESALTFSGYDVAHAWGNHGHDGRPAGKIFPDVMRWLWRDYPVPIKAGVSKNSTLQEIEIPGEGWQKVAQPFQAAAGLAANASGEGLPRGHGRRDDLSPGRQQAVRRRCAPPWDRRASLWPGWKPLRGPCQQRSKSSRWIHAATSARSPPESRAAASSSATTAPFM